MVHIRPLMEYLDSCDKDNKFTCVKYALSHIIDYQHVSIAFVSIIKVVSKHSLCDTPVYKEVCNYIDSHFTEHAVILCAADRLTCIVMLFIFLLDGVY
jgi:hypothetical protein